MESLLQCEMVIMRNNYIFSRNPCFSGISFAMLRYQNCRVFLDNVAILVLVESLLQFGVFILPNSILTVAILVLVESLLQ